MNRNMSRKGNYWGIRYEEEHGYILTVAGEGAPVGYSMMCNRTDIPFSTRQELLEYVKKQLELAEGVEEDLPF